MGKTGITVLRSIKVDCSSKISSRSSGFLSYSLFLKRPTAYTHPELCATQTNRENPRKYHTHAFNKRHTGEQHIVYALC